MTRRASALGLLTLLLTLVGSAVAVAHPLGNLTSNTYAGLELADDGLRVDYVLDLAELPTVQERPSVDTDDDGTIDDDEASRYARARCAELADGLSLSVGGDAVALSSTEEQLSFLDGDAGLTTLRLECLLVAEVELRDGQQVSMTDTNVRERIGWHEITASGDRLGDADVPSETSSGRLLDYPEGVAPLDLDHANATVGRDGGDPLGGLAPTGGIEALETASGELTDLIARQELTLGFVLLAISIATVLGATHALAPGHGKTVMAAYLVSREGTLKQMFGLGSTVAVTHTLGVVVLGVLVTSATALAPERLYPYLGILSGLLFAAVGVWLLIRSRRAAHHDHRHDHDHDHAHGHDAAHDHHHDHGHGHAHPELEAAQRGELGWRTLILPGLAGGMLPSPSALVVLVAGIALGRFAFGLALVLFYGIGMALTLMAAGWLLVKMRHRVVGRLAASDRWGSLTSRLPAVTASLVVLGGLFIAARSALTL